MRDKLKDKEYFQSFLDYQYERIEKKTAKLKGSDGEKRQRILISLTGYEIDLLKAEFSAGASKENLKTLLIRAMSIVSENSKVTYDDLLTLLSLAVILDVRDDANGLISENIEVINADRLLKCISVYIKSGTIDWDKTITIREEYAALDEVFSSDDKEGTLVKYLAGWYSAHSEYAWYNSHLRDTDTYCGYWSFESGAIARVLGLSEDKLCGLEYYPVA